MVNSELKISLLKKNKSDIQKLDQRLTIKNYCSLIGNEECFKHAQNCI